MLDYYFFFFLFLKEYFVGGEVGGLGLFLQEFCFLSHQAKGKELQADWGGCRQELATR